MTNAFLAIGFAGNEPTSFGAKRRGVIFCVRRKLCNTEDQAGTDPAAKPATSEGKKELVGLIDGVRESAQSWRELVVDLIPLPDQNDLAM